MMRHLIRYLTLVTTLPIATSLMFLVGCGGGDGPGQVEPPAELELSVACDAGAGRLELKNSGGSMDSPASFIAACADGAADTFTLQLGAGDSTSCSLANIHGGVTVTCAAMGLAGSVDDCLVETLDALLDDYALDDCLPEKLFDLDNLGCLYGVYSNQITHQPPAFSLVETPTGLSLVYVFAAIEFPLDLEGGGFTCPDLSGDLLMENVVVTTEITINEGGEPEIDWQGSEVTIGSMEVTPSGLAAMLLNQFYYLADDVVSACLDHAVADAVTELVGAEPEALIRLRPVLLP